MIGLIVTGHGHFATGLESALALLGGEPNDFIAVDFPDGEGTDDLTAHLAQALEELSACDGVLVCCDLLGGSPFKAAVTLAQGRADVRVIAGTNLPLLLETHLTRAGYTSVEALADAALSSGHASLVKFEMAEPDEDDVPEEDDDDI